jgi:tRNA (adenine57-N1/adenine58-N1)-methyltransferase
MAERPGNMKHMTEKAPSQGHVFQEADYCLLIDRRDRQYLVHLMPGNRFESHIGSCDLAELIGQPPGTWIATGKGHWMIAFKPTLADFTLRMPRIATVMYPKDLGAMLVSADIFGGARVVEAGAGSGATTMSLLRAVGPGGQVISYDLRQDMLDQALANVEKEYPVHDNLTLKQGDLYQGIDETEVDRVVLDLAEPWQVVPHASEKLVPGGILFSFLPTVLQVHELCQALRAQRTFQLIETLEVIMRPWSVGGRSVRPSHRSIGHTGFITTARKCSPSPEDDRRQPQDSSAAGTPESSRER